MINKESVRRWLRQGDIKGVTPTSRKEGWLIREDDLYDFIGSRLPETLWQSTHNTTNDVKKESVRAEMWWELVRKNIFESYIDVKKNQVIACVQHLKLSKAFEKEAWEVIAQHKRGYATPRIPYLLDAALFDGKRIRMDDHYEETYEQILFAVLEYIRKKNIEV